MQIRFEKRQKVGYFASADVIVAGERATIDVFKPFPAEKHKFPYKWCVELYKGSNYVVGSTSRSYSRMYPEGKGLPAKYKPIVSALRKRLGV